MFLRIIYHDNRRLNFPRIRNKIRTSKNMYNRKVLYIILYVMNSRKINSHVLKSAIAREYMRIDILGVSEIVFHNIVMPIISNIVS